MREIETLCGEIDSAVNTVLEGVKKLASFAERDSNHISASQGMFPDRTIFPLPPYTHFCGVSNEEAARRVLEYDALKARLEKEEREKNAFEDRCASLEKMVKEYQVEIVPSYRARLRELREKAEKERAGFLPYKVGDLLYAAFQNGIERYKIAGISVYIGVKEFYAEEDHDWFCEDGTYILAKCLDAPGRMRINAKSIDSGSGNPFPLYSSLESAEKARKAMQGS